MRLQHHLSLILILCLLAGFAPATQAQALDIVNNQETDVPTLLQYLANGHVLGFSTGKAYLAGLDHALTVEFIGGYPAIPAGEAAPGSDPNTYPTLERVSYTNAWPGIDVIYTAIPNGITKSTYLLAGGADPKQITLAYNVPIKLMPDGSLRFSFESGWLTESAPIAWQDINGQHKPVDVEFIQKGEQTVGFIVGDYNPAYPLAIDPDYTWHTFYGDNSTHGTGIAVDTDGYIYVSGYSFRSWNGPGSAAPLHAYTGSGDIVVLKLSSAGVYQWHTFYGSTENENSYGLDVDVNGNVYIAAVSNASWNGPGDIAPLNAYTGGYDLTVLKLSSAGTYQWHTFYGASADDSVSAIRVDASGNSYFSGRSSAAWNGPGSVAPINAYTGSGDIVVLKLSSAGVYQWHTYYGSHLYDSAYDIALDKDANILVTGYSSYSWNGPGAIPPLNAFTEGNPTTHEGRDIVVLKLTKNGVYQWHTFYGTLIEDYGYAVAADKSGNVYVAGQSDYTWNGPGSASPLNPYSHSIDGWDMVILKLSSTGAYQWHTFYGSSSLSDYASSIAVDDNFNVYMCGESYGTWSGPGGIPPLNPYLDNSDISLLKLSRTGAYQWHTFYGGAQGIDHKVQNDLCGGVHSDGNGNVYLAGSSPTTWDGPGSTAPLNPHTPDCNFCVPNDVVVVKMTDEDTIIEDTIGMYSPPQKTWYLKDANNDGWANVSTVRFGSVDTSWIPVVGDWNGNGTDTIGIYSRGQKTWYLKDTNTDGWGDVSTVRFGSTDSSWIPVVGDWNGNGTDTIGMYSRTQKTWYLKESNTDGWGDVSTVRFGSTDSSWLPAVGDWDGIGADTIGMYSRTQKTWYLKSANDDGWSNVQTVRFGSVDSSWLPVVGDWNANGTDTIGMYSRSQKTWYLKSANDDGWANVQTVRFGSSDLSWVPVTGKW